jgi:hypothetical protein
MVIPEDICECRTNDYPDFVRDSRKASEMALVSRETGQMACKDARQLVLVVVDMREFRSELPLLLHRRGIEVLPIMFWVFWDWSHWTGQVWIFQHKIPHPFQVINYNLFLKPYQVTD